MNAIADKQGIKVARPALLSTVYEYTEGAMWVDTTIPTDLDLHARRPDLILYINATNTIWILDVACTWEPLIEEREGEKIGKYLPLAADMGKREPRWNVRVGALVTGSLGTIIFLKCQLAQLQL